jgi:hypothetical protein
MLEPTEVLGAMITPAVLISAAALILLSTANRLGRVNDRLLHLLADAERLPLADAAMLSSRKRQHLQDQLAGLSERLLMLRLAANGMYVTIAVLVVTSISGGLYVVIPRITNIVPISLGMIAAVAFLYSIVILIQEGALAFRLSQHEIAYVSELLPTDSERAN